jgi:hypothetical protein
MRRVWAGATTGDRPCSMRQLSIITVSPGNTNFICIGFAEISHLVTAWHVVALPGVAGTTNNLSHRNSVVPPTRRSSNRNRGRLRSIGLRGCTRARLRARSPRIEIKRLLSRRRVATSLAPTTHLSAKYLGGRNQCARSVWSGNSSQP